jgi:hypothetical protein
MIATPRGESLLQAIGTEVVVSTDEMRAWPLVGAVAELPAASSIRLSHPVDEPQLEETGGEVGERAAPGVEVLAEPPDSSTCSARLSPTTRTGSAGRPAM